MLELIFIAALAIGSIALIGFVVWRERHDRNANRR